MEGTLRFIPRKDKIRKDGKTFLRVSYSLRDQRKIISTDIYIFPFLWDYQKECVQYFNKKDAKKITPQDELFNKIWQETSYDLYPLSNDVDKLNKRILDIKAIFQGIEEDFKRKGYKFSSEDVILEYRRLNTPLTKKEAPNDLVFDFIDKYIKENTPNRAKGSLQVYKSLKKHLQNYQIAKRTKIRFDKIDNAFMRSFQNFLIQWEEVNPNTKRVKTLNNVTIAKQLTTFKTFLNYAKFEGIEVSEKYKDFKVKRQKLEVIALTERELMQLINLDLSKNEKLDKVRDLFVFSAVTGLRYSDLKQLKRDHILRGEIQITVTKTKELLIIPLNKYSLGILNKYQDNEKPLPIISNQRLNEYLKALCKLAEINDPIEIVRFKGAERITTMHPKWELISIHNGRKTFATLSLEKGMNAETVMKLGGWSDYKSFSRYVNITENVKRKAMANAWGAPEVMKVVGGAE